jgi:hypothetical protein
MTMLRRPSLSVVYSCRSKRSSLAGSGPAHVQRDGATASDHKFLGAEVSLPWVIDESSPVLGVALDHVETFSMHNEKGDEMKRIHGEIPRSAWEKSLEGLTAEHAGTWQTLNLLNWSWMANLRRSKFHFLTSSTTLTTTLSAWA